MGTQFLTNKKTGKAFPVRSGGGISSGSMGGKEHKNAKPSRFARRYKKIEVYKFDEAPDELKQKIIEKYRNSMEENGDTFYSEDQGIMYLKDGKKEIYGYEIFDGDMPKYWNVGYGHEWIQFDLHIKDMKKFAETFGIPISILDRIDYNIENEDEQNTRLELFYDGEEIKPERSYDEFKTRYRNHEEVETDLTKKEYYSLQEAELKFEKLMDESLKNLRNNYEYQFSNKGISEQLKDSDFDYDENGDIV